jgi:abnormal spindle-like microcephaly-associated protein
MDKQSRGMVKWINFTFEAAESYGSAADPSSTASAEGAESHALKVLVQKRREADVRRKAVMLFHSRDMEKVVTAIDNEIDEGKLAIRNDRKLYADVGLREEFLSLILSYHHSWLRLGLETVFGELLAYDSNSSQEYTSRKLKTFVTERLMSDPDIVAHYKTTKDGVFGPAYGIALHRHALKRFLLLVLFLDRAKSLDFLPHQLCLFNKEAPVKSNREMILRFSKVFLSGEGDVTRHLGLLGFSVTYEQHVLDELDYRISKLETDLRDGVRIARLVELLSKDTNRSLSKMLRYLNNCYMCAS